jgi:hypothetical protein
MAEGVRFIINLQHELRAMRRTNHDMYVMATQTAGGSTLVRASLKARQGSKPSGRLYLYLPTPTTCGLMPLKIHDPCATRHNVNSPHDKLKLHCDIQATTVRQIFQHHHQKSLGSARQRQRQRHDRTSPKQQHAPRSPMVRFRVCACTPGGRRSRRKIKGTWGLERRRRHASPGFLPT